MTDHNVVTEVRCLVTLLLVRNIAGVRISLRLLQGSGA